MTILTERPTTRPTTDRDSVRELIDNATAPYRGIDEGRIVLQGRALRLSPREALAWAMAFQELATNASKYGALSDPTGHVEIAWEAAEEPDRVLSLVWQERGGPPVSRPEHKGFGTSLIQTTVVRQLQGRAAGAQVPGGPRVGFTHVYGAPGLSACAVLTVDGAAA